MSAAPVATEPVVAPQTDPQPSSGGDATPTNGGTDGEKVYRTQADVDRAVTARLKREKELLRTEIEAEVKAAAEAERHKEQGQYKPLWETAEAERQKLAARVTELESSAEQLSAALAVIDALNTADMQDAPAYVAEAIAQMDPLARREFLTKHRDQWTRANPRGESALPRAGNVTLSREELIQQEIEALRRKRGR